MTNTDRPTSSPTWKAIPGYEGYYEVSDTGMVRSLDRTITGPGGFPKRLKGKELAAPIHRTGYRRVNLAKEGKQGTYCVHQLVMLAFVGPKPYGYDTCHADGNPANNNLSNLRYDTKRENQIDRIKHGRHDKRNRTHCPRGHLLGGVNNVVNEEKRGHRSCLACSRARNRKRQLGLSQAEFVELAHKYCAELGVE